MARPISSALSRRATPTAASSAFLAGAEVDPGVLRDKLKESLVIGGLSFLLPFAGGLLVTRYGLGWDWRAAEIGGIALSTTSLAVVYAVLVETGLNQTGIGKTIMAATFVTDFGTAARCRPCS
jgi:Kef-type K+ transport system membrane component KefB